MEQESQMIQGTVLAVIYQNPENGYCVLKVRSEQGEAVTVVGVIPMCVVGERLAIVGRWTRHQSFGQQFEAEFLERLMPETTSEILAFLSSRAVKGIGPKMAEKIVSHFGEKSLNVLEQDPMQLTQIPGISEKKAREMSESFQKQSGIRRLIEFLTIYHLPAQLAVRLYRAYGELAQEALRDDPYLLTDSYYRADFSQVDAFAIALGVSADDERRVEAGILFELSYNLGAGHTFIPQDKLRTATCALLDLDGEMIDAGMLRLQEQGRMELSQIAGLTACYLPELYEGETYVCRRILSMADGEYPEPGRIDDLVAEIEDRQGIDYAPEQRSAIRAAASRQLLIVTGGPGTGKTTVMSGILRLLMDGADAARRQMSVSYWARCLQAGSLYSSEIRSLMFPDSANVWMSEAIRSQRFSSLLLPPVVPYPAEWVLARAYLKAGKFRECADMCEQALKRFPNHAGVLETLDKARSSGK